MLVGSPEDGDNVVADLALRIRYQRDRTFPRPLEA
jgi:hypothetical protein